MMNEPASLWKVYGESLKNVWFTFMYASVVPAGCPPILAAFLVNYFIFKHIMLRRSSLDFSIAGGYITTALKLLDVSLLMKPLG